MRKQNKAPKLPSWGLYICVDFNLVMRKQNKTPKLSSWGLYICVDFNFSNEKTKQNSQVTFLGSLYLRRF